MLIKVFKKVKDFFKKLTRSLKFNKLPENKTAVLLHVCCAPCMIHPVRNMREKGMKVVGYFYNPNIFPIDEYQKRRKEVVKWSGEQDLEVIFPAYIQWEFTREVSGNEQAPQRCALCWQLRLKKTAEAAKRMGYYAFSTTLLSSPYQDQETLKKIGERIADETGVFFYYEDFRCGFKEAHQEAKAKGIYCQKYCGCFYSITERWKKSQK